MTGEVRGQDSALALNGDVWSTMFGTDYAKGRMVTGVSLSHTRGLGGYAGGADTGRMTSAVTGLCCSLSGLLARTSLDQRCTGRSARS